MHQITYLKKIDIKANLQFIRLTTKVLFKNVYGALKNVQHVVSFISIFNFENVLIELQNFETSIDTFFLFNRFLLFLLITTLGLFTEFFYSFIAFSVAVSCLCQNFIGFCIVDIYEI